MATVTGDVDIYDVPGGVGNGASVSFTAGRKVTADCRPINGAT